MYVQATRLLYMTHPTNHQVHRDLFGYMQLHCWIITRLLASQSMQRWRRYQVSEVKAMVSCLSALFEYKCFSLSEDKAEVKALKRTTRTRLAALIGPYHSFQLSCPYHIRSSSQWQAARSRPCRVQLKVRGSILGNKSLQLTIY